MEASEKPQQELVPGDGAVRALDDRLVIEALTVTDRRAARVVRERAEANQPPAETVRKAIEIGTRVLDTEETAANVDYVRHELGELDRRLAGTLEEGASDVAERLATVFGADRKIERIVAVTREEFGAERAWLLHPVHQPAEFAKLAYSVSAPPDESRSFVTLGDRGPV